MVQDITNRRFGYLVVIKRIGSKIYPKNRTDSTKGKTYHALWLCQCDCGKTTQVITSKLNAGLTVSCGCHKAKNIGNKIGQTHPCWEGYQEISKTYWNSIIQRTIQKKIQIIITIEQAWELFIKQNRKCALSGLDIAFTLHNTKRMYNTASLDRIDSSKGYIEGNIQWVHKDINYMKWKIPQDKFLYYCKQITQYNKYI